MIDPFDEIEDYINNHKKTVSDRANATIALRTIRAKLQAAEVLLDRIAHITDQPFTETNEHLPDWVATILRTRVEAAVEEAVAALQAEVAMLRTTVEPLFSQRELTKVIAERDDLQAEVLSLTEQIRLRDEACTDLEDKLQAAEAEVEQMQASLDANWVTHQRVIAAESRVEAAEAEVRNERERLIALLLYEGTDAVCTEPEVHHDLKIVSMGFDEIKLRRIINGED